MALATGVIVRAVHSRANFYSACVYLSQSNACLMVVCCPNTCTLWASDCNADSIKPTPPRCWQFATRFTTSSLWSFTAHRNRAAIRKSMVRRHRDLSGHDHLQRRGRGMVRGYVHFAFGWQGLGLDWGRQGRDPRAATAGGPAPVPRTTFCLAWHVVNVRCVLAEVLHLHGSTAS